MKFKVQWVVIKANNDRYGDKFTASKNDNLENILNELVKTLVSTQQYEVGDKIMLSAEALK